MSLMSGKRRASTLSHETPNHAQLEYPAYRQMSSPGSLLGGRHLSPTSAQNLGTRIPGNLGRKPNLLVTSLFA